MPALSRRDLARAAALAALGRLGSESALAQRALAGFNAPPDTVWLNANENPDGLCPVALAAVQEALPASFRYHYREWREHSAAIGRSAGVAGDQVLVGSGSSEILCAAVHAFTAPDRPLIYMQPTFELPVTLAQALGRQTVPVPLASAWAADVKRLREEAAKARGGLIYLCNPNNPTSSLTPKAGLDWLIANLPPNTVVLVDEAYLDFAHGPQAASALDHVRAGREVVVTRTFSKIYGMAGLRIGFGCAKRDLIDRMAPYVAGVIAYPSLRAALAALGDTRLLPERRARCQRVRAGLVGWLDAQGYQCIEPHANFVMIDVKRNARQVIQAMVERGVAPGRPFPPLDNMLRVTLGTETEMAKFKKVFLEVVRG
ncbi:MAG: aminotransferase class I/II-fold pyridoxal phosphate-dependent enzyme [Acidobacteria bacterium]|nr:aminotransferase class I/II-fold pyridoxal phosphate-dependent enzyme [Acidobacteriota bacterium]